MYRFFFHLYFFINQKSFAVMGKRYDCMKGSMRHVPTIEPHYLDDVLKEVGTFFFFFFCCHSFVRFQLSSSWDIEIGHKSITMNTMNAQTRTLTYFFFFFSGEKAFINCTFFNSLRSSGKYYSIFCYIITYKSFVMFNKSTHAYANNGPYNLNHQTHTSISIFIHNRELEIK